MSRVFPLIFAVPFFAPFVLAQAEFAGDLHRWCGTSLYTPRDFQDSPFTPGSAFRPFSADVIYDITIQTPWGERILRNTGKYWHSRTRNIREDDAYGRSMIYDFTQDRWIELDHRSRTAMVYRAPMDRISIVGGAVCLVEAVPTLGPERYNRQLLTGTVEGRQVEGIRNRYVPDPFSNINDFFYWVAPSTRAMLESRVNLWNGQLAGHHRLRNIREGEPDPALFQIPAGYIVTYCSHPSMKKLDGPKNNPYPLCAPPSTQPTP